MPSIVLVPRLPVAWALAIFSIAYFGQQSWSTLVMVLPTDLFPAKVVGSVAGLVGFGGAMGGIAFGQLVGYLLDHGFGYSVVFAVAGTFHVAAFVIILSTVPAVQPLNLERRLSYSRSSMKIKEIRTRVMRWRGKTVPLPPHFCTNPMDLLDLPEASMETFTFHGWLIVEIFTDDGLVGIGNAALAPQVTKQVIDLYLKPLLIGEDPWDIEFLWQHMYRKTMAFGRKGIGMVAISAVDIALWDIAGQIGEAAGVSIARRPDQAAHSGLRQPALQRRRLNELAAEAKRYKDEGYKAMKLRFGWGPTDGAAGMQRNVEPGSHGARNRGRRHRCDGRRLHGLDARLRQAHAAAA